jgi:hypothetical protein
MKIMENEKSPLEDVAEKATDYLNTHLELAQLKAMEYGALAFAALIGKMMLILICFCCLIFASLALAVCISVYSCNPWLGCLVVSGLYFLLFLILRFNRKRMLQLPLANIFIRQFSKKNEN